MLLWWKMPLVARVLLAHQTLTAIPINLNQITQIPKTKKTAQRTRRPPRETTLWDPPPRQERTYHEEMAARTHRRRETKIMEKKRTIRTRETWTKNQQWHNGAKSHEKGTTWVDKNVFEFNVSARNWGAGGREAAGNGWEIDGRGGWRCGDAFECDGGAHTIIIFFLDFCFWFFVFLKLFNFQILCDVWMKFLWSI